MPVDNRVTVFAVSSVAIGAASVNQAVKAIILARKYVERDDYEISGL